jgi:hypothetical protein
MPNNYDLIIGLPGLFFPEVGPLVGCLPPVIDISMRVALLVRARIVTKQNSFCILELLRKWIHACRRKDAFDPSKSAICELHFLPSDYERDLRNELLNLPLRKMLKPGSVPTRNLLPDMMELHNVSCGHSKPRHLIFIQT